MHPDLRNNAVFLRYWSQWRQDPSSIVFASIAEFMLRCGLLDEAADVCKTGLEHHPNFVMGRLVLAKVFLEKNEKVLAETELRRVLRIHPEQGQAKGLLQKLQTREIVEAVVDPKPKLRPDFPLSPELKPRGEERATPWQTITMAKIYATQGLLAKAKQVYRDILSRDPENEMAREELGKL